MKLADYPYVVVRISCRLCRREGQYRLARLAEAHGAECPLETLRLRLTADCPNWRQSGKRRRTVLSTDCQAVFMDLDRPTPPDLPPGSGSLRVIEGGKKDAAE